MDREPRTVILLLGLAALGHLARLAVGAAGEPPGQILAPPAAPSTALEQQRARSARAGRPLARGELVEVNRADASEIARLPRIGMSLAKRIVADREARGGFRGPADLDRVPGVGPALLAGLDGKVSYTGAEALGGPKGPAATDGTAGSYGGVPATPGSLLIDLNSASANDLEALPGIGPARAGAIVAYRREAGPFAAVSDLGRVPGLSRAVVKRIAGMVEVRRY